MLVALLDHCKAEYPRYKRVAKKRLTEYKDQYVSDWKTLPKETALLHGIAAITGASLGLAYVYRQQVKRINNGSWVELERVWVDAMLDRGAVLGMVIDGGQLRAKIFEREETKY